MNHQPFLTKLSQNPPLVGVLTYILALLVGVLVLYAWLRHSTTAKAVDSDQDGSWNLWNCLEEFQESKTLYDILKERAWIDKDVDFYEFDYILVTANQICSMNKNVALPTVLAMIAVESRFDANADNGSAKGLMQVVPRWHRDRLAAYLEEGIDPIDGLFLTPRYNIAVGVDFMNELVEEANGNLDFALMCYNQGYESAYDDYINHEYISDYARTVQAISAEIENILWKGGYTSVSS